MENILYTFPPANNCEFVRWLLQHYEIEHTEIQNAPPFFLGKMLRYLSPQTAIFVGKDGTVLKNVLGMAKHFDALASEEKKLIAVPGYSAEEIEKRLEELPTFGLGMVYWAYYSLLPIKSIMVGTLSYNCPENQKQFVEKHYTFVKTFMSLAIGGFTKKKAAKGEQTMRGTLNSVSDQLADGRKFIMGDKLSMVDFSFAAKAIPALEPSLYGAPIPSYDEYPDHMQKVVRELRDTSAGQYAINFYKQYRHPQNTTDIKSEEKAN